jgi:hypothetical protein
MDHLGDRNFCTTALKPFSSHSKASQGIKRSRC